MNILLYSIKTFSSIFIIMGPFSIIPVFITLTEHNTDEQRKRIIKKSILVSTVVCLIFAFFGTFFFKLFGITINSFRIAGGLLLLIMSVDMLHATRSKVKGTVDEQEESMGKDDISVFPLAIPMITGPGTISTVVLLSSEATSSIYMIIIALAVILSSILLFVILHLSKNLFRIMGQTGLNIITRIMGLILAAIAVEYILQGIQSFFKI
jgi:multiple antibiotic resistance protein